MREPFRDSTTLKGQNLLDADHLKNVEEIHEPGQDMEIFEI
jgi:hypothetical protein